MMFASLLKFLHRKPPTLGQRGEAEAAKFLRKRGYRVLMRNFSTEAGEIDIVARQGDVLVFVEVKTRTSDKVHDPSRQVNHPKQQRMTKAARAYLAHYRDRTPPARFDVVSIVWPEGGKPQVTLIPHAFPATFA